MKNIEEQIRDFYRFLTVRHPVKCPAIKIHLYEQLIEVDDRILFGCVRFNDEATEIHATLKRDSRWLVLKTIAHEYKHIMQRYVDGTLPTTDLELEKSALFFGQQAINEFRGEKSATMNDVVERLITYGPNDGLPRHVVRQRYIDCLQKLRPWYQNMNEALSALGEAIKEHPTYPRFSPHQPMPHNHAREHERSTTLGIMTGYNKLQSWASKNQHYFY